MLIRKNKTKLSLKAEYNDEKWSPLFFAELEKVQDPRIALRMLDEHWLGKRNSEEIEFLIDGTIKQIKQSETFKLERNRLITEIKREISFNTPPKIVELGSGLGLNLIELFLAYGNQIPLISLEYAENAIEFQKKLFANLNISCQFGNFDMFSPQLPEIANGGLVFTSFVFSLMPLTTYELIYSLIKATPSVVIHFEPLFELNQGSRRVERDIRHYIDLNDYNRNLFCVLEIFQEEGLIDIIRVEKNVCGVNTAFPASTIIWKPCL